MRRLTDTDRVKKFQIDENGCWLWTGFINMDGYGVTYADTRRALAHRWFYEYMRGPIPDGLQIDHLCRVRHCVNPWHMEPVTQGENGRRGVSPHAIHARKTHCVNGHAFDEANTYRTASGHRDCRACNRAAVGRYKARQKAQLLP